VLLLFGSLLMVNKTICGYYKSDNDCHGAHIACRG
jgi:hypothetical protein